MTDPASGAAPKLLTCPDCGLIEEGTPCYAVECGLTRAKSGAALSECTHDLAERETACADGYCPICLQAQLTAERAAREAAERDLQAGMVASGIKAIELEDQLHDARCAAMAEIGKRDAEIAQMRLGGNELARQYLEATDEIAALKQRLAKTENLLGRLWHWDRMNTAVDGPYWRRQIDAALASPKGEEPQNGQLDCRALGDNELIRHPKGADE